MDAMVAKMSLIPILLVAALMTGTASNCQETSKQVRADAESGTKGVLENAGAIRDDLIDTAFILGKNAAQLAKNTRVNLTQNATLHPLAPTINSLRGHLQETLNGVKSDKRVAFGLKAVDPIVSRGSNVLASVTNFGRNKFNEVAQQHEQRMKARQEQQ